MSKKFKIDIFKVDSYRTIKPMKGLSTKIQTITTKKDHLLLFYIIYYQNKNIWSISRVSVKFFKKRQNFKDLKLLHCWWECKVVQAQWKVIWWFLKWYSTGSVYDLIYVQYTEWKRMDSVIYLTPYTKIIWICLCAYSMENWNMARSAYL